MRKMTSNEMIAINGGDTAKQCIYCGRRFSGWFSGLAFVSFKCWYK